MGRPLKPLADKIAEGTFRADRVNFGEPQPSPFDPKNPFDNETQLFAWQCWEMVVPELMEKYSVGLGERNLVYEYCWYYQRAMIAGEKWFALVNGDNLSGMVSSNDMGSEKPHPLLAIEDASWDRVDRCAAKLGLNPVDRRKIRTKTGPQGVVPGGNTGVFRLADFERDRSRGPSQLDGQGGTPPAAG